MASPGTGAWELGVRQSPRPRLRRVRGVRVGPRRRSCRGGRASLTFLEAAAVPDGRRYGAAGLRHYGQIEPGQKVLINGLGKGRHVRRSDRESFGPTYRGHHPRTSNFVRSLGADDVVDYTTTDFSRDSGRRYDRILDTVGNRSVSDLRRALADGGKAAVTAFPSMSESAEDVAYRGQGYLSVTAHVGTIDLQELGALADAGQLRPVIDRTYGFSEAPNAIILPSGEGHARARSSCEIDPTGSSAPWA